MDPGPFFFGWYRAKPISFKRRGLFFLSIEHSGMNDSQRNRFPL